MAVTVYSSGLVCCSVCAPADMALDDVLSAVNLHNPTGLSHGWVLSEDKEFADGTPMPADCNTDPTRKHYLLVC